VFTPFAFSGRHLTNLSRRSQDFDQRPTSGTPEVQLITRSTARKIVFQLVEALLNDFDRAIAMPVDDPNGGDPGETVHGERLGAESLRQVKLTIMHHAMIAALQ
jgi:hypothetical protein